MLLNELSTGLVIGVAVLTAFFVVLTVKILRLAAFCREAVEHVMTQNKNAVSLARTAELEAAVTDLADSYHSLLTAHKKLRSRIGMREVRAKRADGESGDNDLHSTDKAVVRLAAKSAGLIK
ncbi:MAG: hypothetical protein ACR2NU_13240 [Aeoliella sp.]